MIYSIFHKGVHIGFVKADDPLSARWTGKRWAEGQWEKSVSLQSLKAVERTWMTDIPEARPGTCLYDELKG